MKGRVVSTKLQKTVTVLVERTAMDPLYKKHYLRTKRYLVDDQLGVKEGDVVEIINIKPVSKNKHWKIVRVIGKSLAEITEEKLKKSAEKTIAEIMPEEKEEKPRPKDDKQSLPSNEGQPLNEKKKQKKNGTA